MTAIADFLPYVVPYASGCADVVAKRAVVEAIDEFCRESWYYRERITAQRILDTDTVVGDFDADFPNTISVEGVDVYPIAKTKSEYYVLSAPAGMRPFQIVEVNAGGTMLKPVTSFVAADVAAWYDKDGSSAYFTRVPNSTTEIFPTPATPDDITMLVAFIPLHNATEVPDILFTTYRQTIADGALSKLYAQPDQPYSDIKTAILKEATFRRGIGAARVSIARGETRAYPQARGRNWV